MGIRYVVHEIVREYYTKRPLGDLEFSDSERFLYLQKVTRTRTIEDIEIPQDLYDLFDKLYRECEEKEKCWIENIHHSTGTSTCDYIITKEIYNKIKSLIEVKREK